MKGLWVVDIEGKNGKTFLENYLSIRYNLQSSDGQIASRNQTLFFDDAAAESCLNVNRAAEQQCDYNTLEIFKNGNLFSANMLANASDLDQRN